MLIDVQNLSFSYDGSYDLIFDHASFQLDTDWRLGFIGRNGRGKTTFLRLLMGQLEYQGRISAPIPFDYFPYSVPHPDSPALEVGHTLLPDEPQWKLLRELSLLGLDPDDLYRPFSSLSGGEQTRLLLAALFCREGHFLLIDEPTNHLDLEGRALVGRYLRQKSGFILVSHDRTFLDGCIDHVLSINKTTIQVQKGNFSTWWENKENHDSFEQAEQERLRREAGRLAQAARKAAGFAVQSEQNKWERVAGLRPDRGHMGAVAAKVMKKAKNVERRRQAALDETKHLLQDRETAAPLALHPLTHHASTLVEAVQLSIAYDGVPLGAPLSFTVTQGERVALEGCNGTGKSSLLKLILGQAIPHSGTLRTASGLILSYVPQDTSFLKGDLDDYIRLRQIDQSLCKTILRKLDFSRLQFEKPMEAYSAGQRKKVLIACSLCEGAHLYIWDEPLNYIDVLSRLQIETLLRDYAPTMLLVEHDRAFLDQIATRVIHLPS